MRGMSLPKFSIRLEMLPGDCVETQVEKAAQYGFDGIALPGRFLDDWKSEVLDGRGEFALPLVSLSLGFEHSLLSPSQSERA